MLNKKKVEIPNGFNRLKDVLAAIQLPGLTDVVAKPVAATVPVKEELPAFDDTTPHCSMALTDLAQPDDDTHNLMRSGTGDPRSDGCKSHSAGGV